MVSPRVLAEHQAKFSKQEGKFDDTTQHERDIVGLGRNLVGTGPFILGEWGGTDRLVLRRNEQYWGSKPGIKEAHLQGIPKGQDRLEAILNDQVDVAILLPLDAVQQLRDEPEVQVVEVPSDSWFFGGINNLHPPFDDRRVRQALNFAVDKDAIVRDVFKGAGRPVDSCIARDSFVTHQFTPISTTLIRPNNYCRSRTGRWLFDRVSLPRGRYPMDYETSLAVAEHLAKIGVSVKVVPYDDWGEYLTYIRQPPERATHQCFS